MKLHFMARASISDDLIARDQMCWNYSVMFIWVTFAVITALTLIGVLWPFLGKSKATDQVRSFDARVYKDQLAEIEADAERGMINSEDAEAARMEVSRRLLTLSLDEELNQDTQSEPNGEGPQPSLNRTGPVWVLAGSIIFIPLFTLAFYLQFGAPLIPSQPHAQRAQTPAGNQSIEALIAKVEQRLKSHPNELRGWTLIAPVYMRLQRFQDAENAYSQVIRLSGESPDKLMRLGEAIVFGNNGNIDSRAQNIFEKVIAADPTDMQAQFWLALAKEQRGNFADAVRAWQTLLAAGTPDAPWRPLVEKHLKFSQSELERGQTSENGKKIAGGVNDTSNPEGSTTTGELRGPSASDIENAKSMNADERVAMINQMVEGLAQRLNSDGGNLQEWQRLIRAYMVLGKREAAQNAYSSALKAFKNDAAALKKLTNFVKDLGLET